MFRTIRGNLERGLLNRIPIAAGMLFAACSPERSSVPVDGGERLARYVVGTLAGGSPADSFLSAAGGTTRLDVRGLLRILPTGSPLEAAATDGVIDRDELDTLLVWAHQRTRQDPERLQDLARVPPDSSDVLTVEVSGSMTRFRRRIRVPVAAIRSAVRSRLDGRGLRYPPGTTIIAEHLENGVPVETTAMRRRDDGFWDFFAFDADGRRTGFIVGEPAPLRVPSDCVGCHYGSRQFEPEKSFPDPAPQGPWGQRVIEVPRDRRNAAVARLLDEHARRDDGVLGPYATLWVSGIVSERGDAPEPDRALARALGF